MPGRPDGDRLPRSVHPTTRDSSQAWLRISPVDSTSFRPSSAFRRVLNRVDRGRSSRKAASTTSRPMPSRVNGHPALTAVIAAAVVVGLMAGFLELAVLVAQVQGLHLVDWSTLMISRHVAWMVPVASILVIVPVTLLLVAPALAWTEWRKRRGQAEEAVSRAWDWTGAVLATFLLLGPLMAIRGFHPVAPVAVAVGIGSRIRRWVVWRTPGWHRGSYWAGGIAIGLLAFQAAWQWNALAD